MPTKKGKDRVYLSEEEKQVLVGLLEEWNNKPDKKTRDSFVSAEALPKIQRLNMSRCGPDIISRDKGAKIMWESRVKAVYTWFKNNKPYKDRTVFKLERKIPLRRVVAKLKADQIYQIVADSSPDLEKGDKRFPGLFQKALTSLMKTLTSEELDEMERTREEWQKAGPPIDVRLRSTTELWLLFGALFPPPIAQPFTYKRVSHDYIADLHAKSHGKKFKTFKEWNHSGYAKIVQDMIGYANYVVQERKEGVVHEAEPVSINFEKGPGDLPLLPTEVKGIRGIEVAKNAREIIRAYFSRHYRCDTARTPWAVIGENPSRFFDSMCLPAGFKFQDPSRMGISVKELLCHLRDRQNRLGVNAFNFQHVLRNGKLEHSDYSLDAQAIIKGNKTEGVDQPRVFCNNGTLGVREPTNGTTTAVGGGTLGVREDVPTNGSPTAVGGIISPSLSGYNFDVLTTHDYTPIGSVKAPIRKEKSISDRQPQIHMMPGNNNITDRQSQIVPSLPHTVSPTFLAINTLQEVPGGTYPSRREWLTSDRPQIPPHAFPPLHEHPGQPTPSLPNPQEFMPYVLHHMGQVVPQADDYANIFGQGPYNGPSVQVGNIDPQLLPSGTPVFAHHSLPHSQILEDTIHGESANTSHSFRPSTRPRKSISPKKTPKRKRSQDLDAYTPSRSGRVRKPTKRLMESMDLDHNLADNPWK